MIDAFLVSGALLCSLLGFLLWEQRRGVRVASEIRYAADRRLVECYAATYRAWTVLDTYVRHDMLARALHMITYTMLVWVRAIEHKLDVTTRFLRAFHRHSIGARRTRRTTRTRTNTTTPLAEDGVPAERVDGR